MAHAFDSIIANINPHNKDDASRKIRFVHIFPLLRQLTEKGKYKNLSLTLTDDSEVIIQELVKFQQQVEASPKKYNLH